MLILGWPVLIVGGLIGGVVGWVIARRGKPWIGSIIGAFAGLVVGVLAFVAYANGWIGS